MKIAVLLIITFFQAIYSIAQSGNLKLGTGAGQNITTGINNTLVGENSGVSLTTGGGSTFVGHNSGLATTGGANVFVGDFVGQSTTSGYYNCFLGASAGRDNTIGFQNTAFGAGAGIFVNNGNNNTYVGAYAGKSPSFTNSNNCTFIGTSATSTNSTLTNSTAIGANSLVTANNSIVLGSIIGVNGAIASTNVGIGVTAPRTTLEIGGRTIIGTGITTLSSGYNLYVSQGILTEKVKISAQANWPDYVFGKDYTLMSLKDVENYITTNNHLPEVPSAEVIAKDGLDLGKMDATLLKKVEELTLYLIEQSKQLSAQQQTILKLQEKINSIEQGKK